MNESTPPVEQAAPQNEGWPGHPPVGPVVGDDKENLWIAALTLGQVELERLLGEGGPLKLAQSSEGTVLHEGNGVFRVQNCWVDWSYWASQKPLRRDRKVVRFDITIQTNNVQSDDIEDFALVSFKQLP